MKTDVKTLLKKGLTGEETGKVVLSDWLRLINSEEALYSQAEIKTLVDALLDSNDVAIYNGYVCIQNALVKILSLTDVYSLEAIKRLQIVTNLLQEKIVENNILMTTISLPELMTEKEYNEKLEAQRKEKLSKTVSLDNLLIDIVEFIYKNYRDKNDKTHASIFEKYSEKELTNPDQLKAWAHEEGTEEDLKGLDIFIKDLPENVIDKTTIPNIETIRRLQVETKELTDNEEARASLNEELKKLSHTPKRYYIDILNALNEFYVFHKGAEDIKAFKRDFPDLFNIALEEIKTAQREKKLSLKENLDTLDLDRYKEIEIPNQEIYNANLEDIKWSIDTLFTERGSEIAIVKDPSPFHIDDKGYYANKIHEPIKKTFDNLFKSTKLGKETVIKFMERIEVYLKAVMARIAFLEICSEITGLNFTDLDSVINVKELRGYITKYNMFLSHAYEDKFKNHIDFGYRYIDLDSFKPTKEKITKAKRKLKDKLPVFQTKDFARAMRDKEKEFSEIADTLLAEF